MDDKGSVRNVDGPSALKIELHVPRRELERNFEIVLLVETPRMELKSSANESCYLPWHSAQVFIAVRVESREHHKVKDRSIWSAGNWSEI